MDTLGVILFDIILIDGIQPSSCMKWMLSSAFFFDIIGVWYTRDPFSCCSAVKFNRGPNRLIELSLNLQATHFQPGNHHEVINLQSSIKCQNRTAVHTESHSTSN